MTRRVKIYSFDMLIRFFAALRPVLLVGAIPLLVLVEQFIAARQAVTLDEVAAWIQGDLAGNPLVFVLTYALVSVTFLSNVPLILAGGALYGPWMGAVWMTTGSLLAALATFLLARRLGRTGLEEWLTRRIGSTAAADWTAPAGFRSIVLLRLLPIFPFSVLNVALGLTRVNWVRYTAGTLVGMFPSTLLLAWAGDRMTTLPPITGVLLTVTALSVAVGYGVHKRTQARRRELTRRMLLVGYAGRLPVEAGA
jgi:uncharacterized membrane protein YdjX (TVP38/TMEM64 family)